MDINKIKKMSYLLFRGICSAAASFVRNVCDVIFKYSAIGTKIDSLISFLGKVADPIITGLTNVPPS